MTHLNEDLLSAWLTLSSTVSNERMVSYLSFNEAFVCHLLYKQQCLDPEGFLTATALCIQTKMLKSQMNKILNSLERKGLIQKTRATTDKRLVYVKLCKAHLKLYEKEHAQILEIIDQLIEKIGIQETIQAINILNLLSQNFNQLIHERNSNGN